MINLNSIKTTMLGLVLLFGFSIQTLAANLDPDYDFGLVGPGTYVLNDVLHDTTCLDCPPSSYFNFDFTLPFLGGGPEVLFGYDYILTLSNAAGDTYLDYLTSWDFDSGIYFTDPLRTSYDSRVAGAGGFDPGEGWYKGAIAGSLPTPFTLTLQVLPVPEPQTWLLMLAGLLLLGFQLKSARH